MTKKVLTAIASIHYPASMNALTPSFPNDTEQYNPIAGKFSHAL